MQSRISELKALGRSQSEINRVMAIFNRLASTVEKLTPEKAIEFLDRIKFVKPEDFGKAKLKDPQSGNFAYVRSYDEGHIHVVIVTQDGVIEDTKLYDYGLLTQFAEKYTSKRDGFDVVWEKASESQSSTQTASHAESSKKLSRPLRQLQCTTTSENVKSQSNKNGEKYRGGYLPPSVESLLDSLIGSQSPKEFTDEYMQSAEESFNKKFELTGEAQSSALSIQTWDKLTELLAERGGREGYSVRQQILKKKALGAAKARHISGGVMLLLHTTCYSLSPIDLAQENNFLILLAIYKFF